MPSLSQLLADKLAADGLSAAAAATKAGLSPLSFSAALKGKSKPNARSVDKYATFLGISAAAVKEAAGGKGAAKGKKRGRPPGKAKKRGRPPGSGKKRGRPPGSGKKRGRPPGSGKKRGRPPGSGKKRGRPPGRTSAGSVGGALAAIGAALKSAEAVLGDSLALKVHNLGKRQRATVEAIIASL